MFTSPPTRSLYVPLRIVVMSLITALALVSSALSAGNKPPKGSPADPVIAFFTGNDGTQVVDADGGNRFTVSTGWHPSWSPDGRFLVVSGVPFSECPPFSLGNSLALVELIDAETNHPTLRGLRSRA